MASRTKRGVYCLEADWWGSPKQHASVRPILELLRQPGVAAIPSVYHDVATRPEFEHYIAQWTQRRFDAYSILYLAFHGNEGEIQFGDGRKSESVVSIDELGELLEGSCKGRIVYFASCETLKVHGKVLNRFLRQTGALGVCGYKDQTDWLAGAAFEILLLDYLTEARNTRASLAAADRRLRDAAGGLAKKLEFRLHVLPS